MSRVGGYYVCQEGEVRCRYRGVEVAAMVMRQRATALAMRLERLDASIEIGIRSPSAERLEVRGWPAQYQPPGSTRSGVMKCTKTIAH